jgi:P27 family predicted phage terminase small subunit
MARPRKPESVKELSGTARPDRKIKFAPSGDRLLIEALKPPKILSRPARAEWKILAPRVAALGLLTTTTVRSFQLLCETLSTVREAEALVAKNGFTIPTKDGGQKKNPAVSILEIARGQARQLFAEFGLTPRSRQSVDTTASLLPSSNPFAKFNPPAPGSLRAFLQEEEPGPKRH